MTEMLVLAIDPGSTKVGVALVSGTTGSVDTKVVHKAVIERQNLLETIKQLTREYAPGVIILGNGTRHQDVLRELKLNTSVPAQVVDEHGTTLEARKLYFKEHPPRGWHRLIPTSMQLPQELYDDYVAVLLARRYLETL